MSTVSLLRLAGRRFVAVNACCSSISAGTRRPTARLLTAGRAGGSRELRFVHDDRRIPPVDRRFVASDSTNKQEDEEDEVFVEEDLVDEHEDHELVAEEEDEADGEPKPPISAVRPPEVVAVLEEHRAKRIEVVECTRPQSPARFLVIASPFNRRHGEALTEVVRQHFCKRYSFGGQNPMKRKTTNGWYLLDLQNTIVHVMREDLREQYDLAAVWGAEADEEDVDASWLQPDRAMIPPANRPTAEEKDGEQTDAAPRS